MEGKTNNLNTKNITYIYEKNWIEYITSFFLNLPLFLIIKQKIPSLNWPLYIDNILLFLLLWGLVSLLVNKFKTIVFGLLIIIVILLAYGSFFGSFGFGSFIKEYKVLIEEMNSSNNPSKTLVYKLTPDNENPYNEIIDNILINETIEEKALYFSENFISNHVEMKPENELYLKSFSIYKNVKQNWTYIKDLKQDEHYNAAEIIDDMQGDYDEFTILICSLLKSIGGKVNILYKNHNEMHPILFVEKQEDESEIRRLIKATFKESYKKNIHFIHDSQGQSWLVLSYFHNYPGGEMPQKNSEYKFVNIE